ncbi:hypothetical protein CCHOA_01260 [Corynebacterium choanae]|uniref:Uncharacterized protein n=1 Tax=Corynebacterium choanae TaxID=1862358 RepID=A0A3G6J8A4_9CORY|nr:hypothetical protein CCHOA_01260 [Corynebacterium choanae]
MDRFNCPVRCLRIELHLNVLVVLVHRPTSYPQLIDALRDLGCDLLNDLCHHLVAALPTPQAIGIHNFLGTDPGFFTPKCRS